MQDKEFAQVLAMLAGKTLSTEQYQRLVRSINNMADRRRNKVKYSLRRGDKVKWTGRGGYVRTGTLIRTMRKNAEVTASDDGLTWRVPMSILEKA